MTVSNARQVMFASATPEECIRRAQVIVVHEDRWEILAPFPYHMTALIGFAPVPREAACPVVDVSRVCDGERMRDILRACVDPMIGVFNKSGLLTGLEALGGEVKR